MRKSAHNTPSTVIVIVLSALGMLLASALLSLARTDATPPPTQVAALTLGDESIVATPEPAQQVEQDTAAALHVVTPPPVNEVAFEVGNDLTIAALRTRYITGSEITFEEILPNGANYSQYIASYVSEGNRIYGLLTVLRRTQAVLVLRGLIIIAAVASYAIRSSETAA